jgi:two-component system alkaline phosphatase synthesis response regulator PhoP
MQQAIENLVREIREIPGELVKKQAIIKIISNLFENIEYPIVEYNDFIIDMNSRTILCNGNKVHLPKKQFLIVHHLAKHSGRVVPREELLRDVWGTDVIVGERTIDVHIRKIRTALPTLKLKTIKCLGYKLQD